MLLFNIHAHLQIVSIVARSCHQLWLDTVPPDRGKNHPGWWEKQTPKWLSPGMVVFLRQRCRMKYPLTATRISKPSFSKPTVGRHAHRKRWLSKNLDEVFPYRRNDPSAFALQYSTFLLHLSSFWICRENQLKNSAEGVVFSRVFCVRCSTQQSPNHRTCYRQSCTLCTSDRWGQCMHCCTDHRYHFHGCV